MPEPPSDLHDIILRHDFERDVRLRRELIAGGVFVVPIATKQWSISAAHLPEDIAFTLERFERAVAAVMANRDGEPAREAALKVSASGNV
jgi:glutamate-1-semialdehyde 2,1-aminomutase